MVGPAALAAFASAALAAAPCPAAPELRDDDGEVTVLEQNVKFILTGERRAQRAALLARWLATEGARVDVLALSEARITGTLDVALDDFCFYTQAPEGEAYRWVPVEERVPPGGLVVGVRTREVGDLRSLQAEAGREFRAAPSTLVEGVLGRMVGYRKGWADLVIDGTHVVWSHTQASYRAHPERGAGGRGRGRAGQFDDLADDLDQTGGPILLTGDLNLLDRFRPWRARDEGRVRAAREIDHATARRFEERTGIDFHWPRLRAGGEDATDDGTFLGGIFRRAPDDVWDLGARYDRVGVNEQFKQRHPGTKVRRVEIAEGSLRVSDHLGLVITIPFGGAAGR